MAESGASASQQQASTSSTSSIFPDVALVAARNMAVDSRITHTEASSKTPVSPVSPLPTSKINNSADSIILQTLQGIANKMRVFEQDAQSDRQLLASVVEKLESHDEVLVKIATDEKRRHKSTGSAKGGKSAKNNFSNMNSGERQINNSQQNLLSTNNSIFSQSLNNLQVQVKVLQRMQCQICQQPSAQLLTQLIHLFVALVPLSVWIPILSAVMFQVIR